MKVLRTHLSSRTVLWPVILTVVIFLIFLGMRPPIVSKPQKPRLRPRAVIENLVKTVQSGIEKSVPAIELCRRATVAEPPSFTGAVVPPQHSIPVPLVVSLTPSRAPPAPLV